MNQAVHRVLTTVLVRGCYGALSRVGDAFGPPAQRHRHSPNDCLFNHSGREIFDAPPGDDRRTLSPPSGTPGQNAKEKRENRAAWSANSRELETKRRPSTFWSHLFGFALLHSAAF